MLSVTYTNIAKLIPYARNPRKNDAVVERMVSAIKEFGFRIPIVAKSDGAVVDGHLRLKAAQVLGMTEVPVVLADELSDAQVKAFRLLANRSANWAEWDNSLLKLELDELLEADFPLELTGFDEADLKLLKDATIKEAYSYNPELGGTLAKQFLLPPFSVLNAREGAWQDRKQKWIELGIDSAKGRDENLLNCSLSATMSVGDTSIFDPVLCEIIYLWFTRPGALIVDPFAGGSVRGITAWKLGRHYVGVDLRDEQVRVNINNYNEVISNVRLNEQSSNEEFVNVKVSAAMLRTPFVECEPNYITNKCHSSCCQSSTKKDGTLITIHPSEEERIKARGGIVVNGLLQAVNGKCPFKGGNHLCQLHFTPDKPFGCIASPFTLNKNGTLIVRNRYKMLKCFRDGGDVPAYVNFRPSLDLIFGKNEADRICKALDEGTGDFYAKMPKEAYSILMDNDDIKHGNHNSIVLPEGSATWRTGDSLNIDKIAGEVKADFVFSCPPYVDLEVYSDNPADLSNMAYADFIQAYTQIIAKSCALLKNDRFACFVVGEVRDKKGNYHNFVSDTINAFKAAGLKYYNEAILVTVAGSLPLRAGKQFKVSRKLGKTHQNILVFVKGDARKATEYLGDIELPDLFIGDVTADEG